MIVDVGQENIDEDNDIEIEIGDKNYNRWWIG